MRRLVWDFAGRTYHIVGNFMSWLNYIMDHLYKPSFSLHKEAQPERGWLSKGSKINIMVIYYMSLDYCMIVKLLAGHHLEFLSLKGGCTGTSESTLVKMPHCWKSHVTAHMTIIFIIETWLGQSTPNFWLSLMKIYINGPVYIWATTWHGILCDQQSLGPVWSEALLVTWIFYYC